MAINKGVAASRKIKPEAYAPGSARVDSDKATLFRFWVNRPIATSAERGGHRIIGPPVLVNTAVEVLPQTEIRTKKLHKVPKCHKWMHSLARIPVTQIFSCFPKKI